MTKPIPYAESREHHQFVANSRAKYPFRCLVARELKPHLVTEFKHSSYIESDSRGGIERPGLRNWGFETKDILRRFRIQYSDYIRG